MNQIIITGNAVTVACEKGHSLDVIPLSDWAGSWTEAKAPTMRCKVCANAPLLSQARELRIHR